MNILVNETQPLTAMGIQYCLTKELEGARVILAEDHKGTLAKLQNEQIDILILDTSFLCRIIRQNVR